MTEGKNKVGQTKSTGFEFGLRKTFPIPLPAVWQYLMSPEGIRIWLGDSPDFRLEKGAAYHTVDGATGKVTTFNPEVNVRLTWQPVGWSKPSTLQVRVIAAGEKTTVSFHQENLPDAQTREAMLERWKRVATDIETQMLNSLKK
jgi:uncharacterized protein YndB with AHSA1/START domain